MIYSHLESYIVVKNELEQLPGQHQSTGINLKTILDGKMR